MNIYVLVRTEGDSTRCTALRPSKAAKPPKELLEVVKRIERKSFPSSEVMDFDTELRKANTSLLCVCDEANGGVAVVAYLVYAQTKGAALLHKVCVKANHRRRGLASSLVTACLEHLRTRNCTYVQLWVDEAREPARRLYATHGFRQVERVEDYYGPGRTGLQMVLDLENAGVNVS